MVHKIWQNACLVCVSILFTDLAGAQTYNGVHRENLYAETPSGVALTPGLFLVLPPDPAQTVAVVQAEAQAIASAYTDNTKTPLRLNLLAEESLQMLSSYDLQMTKAVTGIGGFQTKFKSFAALKYIGGFYDSAELDKTTDSATSRKLENPDVKKEFAAVFPWSVDHIRLLNSQSVWSKDFTFHFRQALAARIEQNFRNAAPFDFEIPALNRAQYLLHSYEPVMVSGNIIVDTYFSKTMASRSLQSHSAYFSMPGELVVTDAAGNALSPNQWHLKPISIDIPEEHQSISGMATFDNISLGTTVERKSEAHTNNLDMMLLEYNRHFSEAGTLHLRVSFGKLDLTRPIFGAGQSELSPLDFSDPQSGIVLRGHFVKTRTAGAGLMTHAYEILRDAILKEYQVRVTLNRLAFDLHRGGSRDPDEAVRQNLSYDISRIQLDPSQTIMHISLFTVVRHTPDNQVTRALKEAHILPFLNYLSTMDNDNPVQTAVNTILGLKCFEEKVIPPGALQPDEICMKDFASSEALDRDMGKILRYVTDTINQPVVAYGQKQTSKLIDFQVPFALDGFDHSLETAVTTVLQRASAGKAKLDEIVSTLLRFNRQSSDLLGNSP